METKNYRWEEKKSVKIINNILMYSMVFGMLIFPFIVFPFLFLIIDKLNPLWMLSGLFIPMPIMVVLSFIGIFLSDQNSFSRLFINEIKTELNIISTLEDLYKIRDKFENEAHYFDGKIYRYRLSYRQTLYNIHKEIYDKIDILEKQQKVL